MNILLSFNYKCFKMQPDVLIDYIETINSEKYIKGFEVNASTEEDKKYLKELAKECKLRKYILNIHLPILENIEEYKKYLDYLKEVSNIYQSKINMVFHPIYSENKIKSILITEKYISEILKYIELNGYNFSLSIENLNDMNGMYRLKKEDLKELLQKYQKLNFTYDIGHEYIDNQLEINTDKFYINKINNIHVHTFKEKDDHYPIEEISSKNILLNKVIEIKKKGYDGNIVLEYALDYIKGENFEEKINKYIENAKKIYYCIN